MTNSQRKTFQNLLKKYGKPDRWDLSLDFVVKELSEAAGADLSFEDASCLLEEISEEEFTINDFSEKDFTIKESDLYAQILLLALYFALKYHETCPVAPEDAVLLAQYEELMLSHLDRWLAQKKFAAHENVIMAIRRQAPAKEAPASEVFAEKESAKKEFAEKATAKEILAEKESAKKEFAKEEPASEALAEKESAKKEFAEKELASEALAEKESAKKEFAKKAPVKEVLAEKEFAKKESAEKEPAKEVLAVKMSLKKALAEKMSAKEASAEEVFTKEITAAIKSGRLTLQHVNDESAVAFIGGMAYLNFQLSGVLRSIVKVCLALHSAKTLCAFAHCNLGWRTNADENGGDYDTLFGIDPQLYICWAAAAGYKQILKKQLAKNPEAYLQAVCAKSELLNEFSSVSVSRENNKRLRPAAVRSFFQLLNILKDENIALYKYLIDNQSAHEHMIDLIVMWMKSEAGIMRNYLEGKGSISDLYPYVGRLPFGIDAYEDILCYQRHCTDKAFLDRWQAAMALCGASSIRLEDSKEAAEALFCAFERVGMDCAHQLGIFSALYKEAPAFRGCSDEALASGAVKCFARYFDAQQKEVLAAFLKAGAEGHFLALRVMKRDLVRNQQAILSFAADRSKLVKNELFDILCAQRDWVEEVKALLHSKKAQERELAARVISRWQEDSAILLQAVERERDAALLKWAYKTPFCVVHRTDGSVADKEALQSVLYCYASFSLCGVSKEAQKFAGEFVPEEFASYVNELFDKWIAAGAAAKKRWVLYVSSIYGGDDIIKRLQRYIPKWTKESRWELAAEAVRALSLNPSPRALFVVDDISRKAKNTRVRNAAVRAFDAAAQQLKISREELADRIVPDLGFDRNLQRTFDYGTRIFQTMLTPVLEVEIFDEKGRKLKKLPAPKKTDDADKAAAACEAFKLMKKELETVVSNQKSRFEYALSYRREWNVNTWKALFIDNPLMHQFAIGLVWGVYENARLAQSFRYMEDGSFNTPDGEECTLPEQAQISLVHPIELSAKLKAAWTQQFEDYEIRQPFAQLARAVYEITQAEADRKSLERFSGCRVNERLFDRKMAELGWLQEPLQRGGSVLAYYRKDIESGMGARLHFSGRFIEGANGNVTLGDVRFYKAGMVEYVGNGDERADPEQAYLLKDVPPRYFSEIVLQLTEVAALAERDYSAL